MLDTTGAMLGGFQSMFENFHASREAKKSWKRQKKVLQRQFGWRVRDIERAGYNPLLAFQGSGVGGGGGSAPMAHTIRGQSVTKSGLEQAQQATAKAQLDLIGAQTAKESNSARLIGAQADMERIAADYLNENEWLKELQATTNATGNPFAALGVMLWNAQRSDGNSGTYFQIEPTKGKTHPGQTSKQQSEKRWFDTERKAIEKLIKGGY